MKLIDAITATTAQQYLQRGLEMRSKQNLLTPIMKITNRMFTLTLK